MKYITGKTIFSHIKEHMYDSEPWSNHLDLLMKAIAEKYLQVWYSFAGKNFTAILLANNEVNSRQTFTKLIHFSGQ